MTIMVRKEEFTNFSLFFKNFANLRNTKLQKYKNTKMQNYKKSNKLIL